MEQIGQCMLETKNGESGMGEAYRARHAMLRRPTPRKLLRREWGGTNAVARFEREVQLTNQLTHSNTIAIYDYGRTSDDVFYYAMKYLDGLMSDWIVFQDRPLPEDRVIQILA